MSSRLRTLILASVRIDSSQTLYTLERIMIIRMPSALLSNQILSDVNNDYDDDDGGST